MQATRELKISSLRNKIEQLRRKVLSDSAEWKAAVNDKTIATEQYERAKNMHTEGIISLVDFEKGPGLTESTCSRNREIK